MGVEVKVQCIMVALEKAAFPRWHMPSISEGQCKDRNTSTEYLVRVLYAYDQVSLEIKGGQKISRRSPELAVSPLAASLRAREAKSMK